MLLTLLVSEVKRDGRFIAYDNGTVRDTQTGLMWAAKDNGKNIDWRLPTQDELHGVYNSWAGYPAACDSDFNLKITGLIRLTCLFPWASETRGSVVAAYVLFNLGIRHWRTPSTSRLARSLRLPVGRLNENTITAMILLKAPKPYGRFVMMR